jgi:hypothetical protein
LQHKKYSFMRLFIVVVLSFLGSVSVFAQLKLGNNPNTLNSSALLELESTNKGFLPARMTQSERNAIASPATGLLVYQTDAANGFYYYSGSSWINLDGVPQGAIMMWSGSFASIPLGWALCDGTGGTPDLRDRFILGASISSEVGNTGGNNSYNLTVAQLPAHNHTGNTDNAAPSLTFTGTAASHNHTATLSSATTSSNGGGQVGNMLWDDGAGYYASGTLSLSSGTRTRSWSGTSGNAMRALNISDHNHTVSGTVTVNNTSITPAGTISGSNHSHSFTTDNTGLGNAIDNRPAFYKLAFIIKM